MCWVVFEVFGFLMEFEWHELLNEQPGLAKRFLFFEVLPYAYNRVRVFSTLLMSKCDGIPHIGEYLSELLRLFLYTWYTSHMDVLVNLVSELAAVYYFTDFVMRSLAAQYAQHFIFRSFKVDPKTKQHTILSSLKLKTGIRL